MRSSQLHSFAQNSFRCCQGHPRILVLNAWYRRASPSEEPDVWQYCSRDCSQSAAGVTIPLQVSCQTDLLHLILFRHLRHVSVSFKRNDRPIVMVPAPVPTSVQFRILDTVVLSFQQLFSLASPLHPSPAPGQLVRGVVRSLCTSTRTKDYLELSSYFSRQRSFHFGRISTWRA